MARRLLRVSVLTMLTVALLLGGGPAATDAVHADPDASSVAPPGSGLRQASEQFELRPDIAFTSSRAKPSGNPLLTAEIYLKMMNAATWDKTPPLRLTENGSGEGFAAIRMDGKNLVFDSNRDAAGHNESLFISDLYLMNLEDSDELQHSVPDAKQVHLTRGSSATWSPDGKKIAFHASRSGIYSDATLARRDPGAPTLDSDIFVMNVDDCLNNLVDCRAKEKAAQPGVLPDFLKNLTRGTSPTIIDEDPDWSPDGQKIVFTSHDGEQPTNPHAEIYVMNADGTGTPQRLTVNTEEERSPAWSPDGTKIVYMCRRPGFEICVMNADGTGQTQLTINGVTDATPQWSPDGNYLVFHRPVGGPTQLQLFVMKADGTGQTQVTSAPDDPGRNSFPSWDLVRVRVPKAR